MDRRTAIGQHFITGFEGTELTPAFFSHVRKYKTGNVLLFRENIADRAQLRRLCEDLTALIESETGFPPFITIDQEGGTVSRLGEDATVFPSAMALAATGDATIVREAARITGVELSAMGVNFDFAPVVDVNSNPKNPVIGVRSFGDDPARVAEFGAAVIAGLRDGGVLGALKHFPGHGDTLVDSHYGLPVIEKTLEELRRCELIPFQRAIDLGAPAVMTAHILFPRIEPGNLPATMSRRIITELLRGEMGFEELIISDCMMMKAIASSIGTVPGTLAAFRAGVDMAIISHSEALTAEAIEAMEDAMDRGEWDEAAFRVSAARIQRAKARLTRTRPELDAVGAKAHRELCARIVGGAITLVNDAPFALGARPAFIGCSRFRTTPVSNRESAPLCFAGELKDRIGGVALPVPQDPTEAEIRDVLEKCAGCSSVTVGTCNGILHPGQLALVRAAAQLDLPVCCVAMRSPYDLAGLPAHMRSIAAYDYDRSTLAALAEVLTGRRAPKGTRPVRL